MASISIMNFYGINIEKNYKNEMKDKYFVSKSSNKSKNYIKTNNKLFGKIKLEKCYFILLVQIYFMTFISKIYSFPKIASRESNNTIR